MTKFWRKFLCIAMSCLFGFAGALSCVDGEEDGDDAGVMVDLVWIPLPGGSFYMGCSPDDPDCNNNEIPRHEVFLSPFDILETEVTVEQYEAVIGQIPGGDKECGQCPVQKVDWYEAMEFCEAVSGRLPTEAEWEYAARGGTTTRYSCGDDESCLDDIAWYIANSGEHPHTVKQKLPNVFGLYDMLGNVEEWVSDWYDYQYYQYSPTNDPQGPNSGEQRLMRGPSCIHETPFLRVSGRYMHSPTNRAPIQGVRCVRDP